MLALGPIAFTTPWLLLGLFALPVLWWLLRAMPPAPARRRFAAVSLLLGLKDAEAEPHHTPWWLLLLRAAALALLIAGLAGPILNPREATGGRGPLLILADASWASAQDWPARLDAIEAELAAAGRAGRPVAVVTLADPPAGPPLFQPAEAWEDRTRALTPSAWEPGADRTRAWRDGLGAARFDTVWLSDGLARPDRAQLRADLAERGALRVIEGAAPRLALARPALEDGALTLSLRRSAPGPAADLRLIARGTDPTGAEAALGAATIGFAIDATAAEARFDMPLELANRVERIQVEGVRSAGAVALSDDSVRRRKVALYEAHTGQERADLLSPAFYLRRALAPVADVVTGDLDALLLSAPDVLILPDAGSLGPAGTTALRGWVEDGGTLIRFAGPRLAAAAGQLGATDPLLPVALRAGGRSVGGAMSWGEPRRLRPFPAETPFAGLDVPEDVTVTAQVLAQPGPELAERTWAALADGTPLVTAKPMGNGRVVLFHVTANAEWSSLPLSGLYVRMLDRLVQAGGGGSTGAADLEGRVWSPEAVMDGFGALRPAGTLPGVDGAALAAGRPGPDMPPGLYSDGTATHALQTVPEDRVLAPAAWPAGQAIAGLTGERERPLGGPVLAAALALLLIDILATLWLGGRLAGGMARAAPVLAAAVMMLAAGGAVQAQTQPGSDAAAIRATTDTVLAHVRTGNADADRAAEAGLSGLSAALNRRTSIEPAAPIGVDIERDELTFFPLLYWPVTETQPVPSAAAYERLNAYLRTGGMIVFDTRDGDLGGFGATTPAARKLRDLAAPLDIPPLEPVPPDHVLTRSFYLLQEFPGRHAGGALWVEAAPADAERVEGVPFRNLNDGVTPVVIGGNDWAAAWAVDGSGRPIYRVGRGAAGERQRELAYRFGINLVMHVLTGNYKSDQVHVPALLDRLGQ
jgi:hypothetical protein